MKKHLTILHLLMASAMLASVAFGWSDRRKQTDPGPATTATLNLNTGEYTADYSGQSQSAAGNSRIADTGASGVATAFAQKSDPTTELAWFDINRAAEDQPDVATDLQLANEHKSAVESLKSLTAGGNPTVAALNLATEALKVVKDKIAAREREKAARGKADTSAFRATAYLQGPGAVTSVAVMAGTMGAAVANGNEKRATYQSSINEKQIDTSNTNDYAGVAAVLKTQLEMTKLELEIAKLKQAVTPAKPTTPPGVKPDPAPTPTPAPVGGFSCTPKFHTGDEMAHANSKTTPRESPKLPTDSKFRYIGNRDLGQGDYTAFIPADRPLLKAAEIRQGSKVICPSDIQWAPSQNRQRLIFVGAVPDGRATLACAYVDGGSETFVIEDLNGEQNSDTPAYKRNVEPVDPPPNTSSLFTLEPDKLTLRPDFAAAVRTIDVLTKINDPNVAGATNSVPSSVRVDAGKLGPYTWGIPKPLGSYPRGNMPNTWRIGLFPGKIPADVTYHKSIKQTFIQDGATVTFPPTTRE